MTKLSLVADRVLEASWLVAAAIVPMFFNILSGRVFEPDKIVMLRSIVVVMALAQVVKWLEGIEDRKVDIGADSSGGRSRWKLGNPLALPALGVAATYLVGTAMSITPWISFVGSYQRLQGTYTMLTYIALFFLVAGNLRRREQLERLFTVALLVSLPISLYGIVQHLRMDPLPWGGDVVTRVTSTMGNAIFIAAYLIMVVPITLQRLIGALARVRALRASTERVQDESRLLMLVGILIAGIFVLGIFTKAAPLGPNLWWASLSMIGMFVGLAILFTSPRATFLNSLAEAAGYALLLGLQLVTLFLSGSRGPWIGMMAGLACFLIVLAIRRRARLLLGATATVGLAALAFLIVFNLPDSPLAPARQIPLLGRLGELTQTESGTGRVRTLIWQGSIQLLTTHPALGLNDSDPLGPARLLVGYGPESMYVAFNKVYPPDLAHYEARNASPDRNHNNVLDYLVTVGLLGLAAYVALLVVAFRLVWRRLRQADSLPDQLIFAAILSALVAHVVESQVGIAIAVTYTYFWLYLAIVSAAVLWQRAAPVPAEAVATPAAVSVAVAGDLRPSTTRTRRRRGASTANAVSVAGASYPIRPYPVVAYSALVLVAVVLLLRSPVLQQASSTLQASFLGLLLAIFAIALALGRWSGQRFWRTGNAPLYGLGALAAFFLVLANLNVVAADISFKRGFGNDQAGQFATSIGFYQDALRLAGDQDYYYLFTGRAYLEMAKQTRRSNAVPAFQPTIETLQSVPAAQLSSLGRDDLFNASRVVLERARELNPLNTDHYANLGRLYRTWGEPNDRPKLDLAADFFRQATTVSPQSAQLFGEWAQLDLIRQDADGAVQRSRRAVEIDPKYPWSFLLLGDALAMQGRVEEALVAHGQALDLDPAVLSDQRFEQRVGAYDQAQMLPGLEALYAKLVQRAPRSAAAHSAYGVILARQNRLTEALAQFQAGVALLPDDWLGHRNIAFVYRALGQQDQAVASAQAALRYAPADQASGIQNLISDLKK